MVEDQAFEDRAFLDQALKIRDWRIRQRLAGKLGVSQRAARRYIQILREAGIPIESVRGHYGGYRVGRALRLPPLMFSAGEALGLVMAVLDGHHDASGRGCPSRRLTAAPRAGLERECGLCWVGGKGEAPSGRGQRAPRRWQGHAAHAHAGGSRAVKMILWHEPERITHAEAAAKTRYAAHPSVGEFAREVEACITGGDGLSHVILSVKDSAVPSIRYLAGKHRLVCYEPRRRAVLNPPLLRRAGAYELAFCVGHSIDDPSPEHLAEAVRGLTDENWFIVLNDGDEHFVQVARSNGTHLVEYKDVGLFQTEVADAAVVIEALCEHAAGAPWRDRFGWRPVG